MSDPAPDLFGPLRAGSLTPTYLVSVVLEEAALTRGEIVAGFVLSSKPRYGPRAPDDIVMITRARSVVP